MHVLVKRTRAVSWSPRSVVLWGVVVSSWLAPALLPVAAAQAVVGVSTGINNTTGERPARININDLYDEAGPHWDLYIQALDLFQREDMSEITSYYQIAGIHGLPFVPWNGVDQVPGGANSGYCPHGQTTFITWHRPYLALFEQIIAHYARKAAKQYPVETVDTYHAAAQTFRIPYWDWAHDASMPPAVIAPTANFNSPSGPATMRNPLYSFQFPNFPFHGGGFGGSLVHFNETKRCTQVSGSAAGVNDMAEADNVLTGDGAQLQDKVYAVFTQSTTFEAMATMSNAGASFEEPHNVVHDDIACFSVAGRTGHMGDLNWSGFDPIFMLHHANVDRLYAMWQAINYGDPVFTSSQRGNALFGTAAGAVTADSPLRPFFATSSGSAFHTSRSVEAIRTFGYTYPEIDDWSLGADDLAATVRTAVNNLYGPDASTGSSSSTKRKRSLLLAGKSVAIRATGAARRSRRPAATTLDELREARGGGGPFPAGRTKGPVLHGGVGVGGSVSAAVVPSVLSTNDYSVEVGVDRTQVPLPCTIELHLLGFDGRGNSGGDNNSSSAKIGSTSILSMPQTGTSYSITPLRRVLLAEAQSVPASVSFVDSGAVLAHLRERLRVVIKSDGDVVSVAAVWGLSIEVQQRSYTAVSADDEFPRYGPVQRWQVQPCDLSTP